MNKIVCFISCLILNVLKAEVFESIEISLPEYTNSWVEEHAEENNTEQKMVTLRPRRSSFNQYDSLLKMSCEDVYAMEEIVTLQFLLNLYPQGLSVVSKQILGPHVVQELAGFCDENKDHLILAYYFVGNERLVSFLYISKDTSSFEQVKELWMECFKNARVHTPSL